MLNKQVTLKDLARKLRLSVSTVSRALRDAPDINPETKQMVKEMAEALNYEPNFIAQSLIKKSTKTIGVILPVLASDYFSTAVSGMMEVAEKKGYNLMFCLSNESAEREVESIRKLISCRVDGLLISVSSETVHADEFLKVQQKEIPLVFFDRALEEIDAFKVVVDQYGGAFKAVEHLIAQGYNRIAHIGGPAILALSNHRMEGYRDALLKHGLPLREDYIIHCEHYQVEALEAVQKLFSLNEKPNAIFAINDTAAIICMTYLKEQGYRIPEDVGIVGHDNKPTSQVVEPSLTTVMQPSYQVGELAMQLLIDEIEHHTGIYQEKVLNSELLIRHSSVPIERASRSQV